MKLPEPRGSLSGALITALARDPYGLAIGATADSPDDLQLALLILTNTSMTSGCGVYAGVLVCVALVRGGEPEHKGGVLELHASASMADRARERAVRRLQRQNQEEEEREDAQPTEGGRWRARKAGGGRRGRRTRRPRRAHGKRT